MRHLRAVCVVVAGMVLSACASAQPGESGAARDEQRPLEIGSAEAWQGRGISYGPHRAGQSPSGAQPTREQIAEDLRILDPYFDMIRMYGSGDATRTALEIIREEKLGLRMMVGAWLDSDTMPDPDNAEGARIANIDARLANRDQVQRAIDLANEFSDVVFAINIGNESQVFWTGHPVSRERLIEHIRWARANTTVPVTTADDFNFWNKPESLAVARECDFIGLHAYAMWNGQQLEDAKKWTRGQITGVRAVHPEIPIVLCEFGWATKRHTEGQEAELIKGAPGEAEQARFVREFLPWLEGWKMAYFYFEAFDEPWKGPAHPDAVEKHWGLWHESREPKQAVRELKKSGD